MGWLVGPHFKVVLKLDNLCLMHRDTILLALWVIFSVFTRTFIACFLAEFLHVSHHMCLPTLCMYITTFIMFAAMVYVYEWEIHDMPGCV